MDSGAGVGGATAIRVPYRHLRDAEMELVSLNGSPRAGDEGPPPRATDHQLGTGAATSRAKVVLACMVAAGVQFGWALQLSLLTPYIQTLGIDHAMASFIWLCGPITGFVVQPCVGVWSDKCRSKYGRRRPFILAGCLMICAAVTLIGFSADLGYILGDTTEHCRTYKGSRYRAAIVFILGFWMLDLANNTVQGPARALLADLSGPDQCNSANAIFCSWMAVGNILGFSAGASGNWHKWFPFLTTRACCEACGNLKAAFLVAVVSFQTVTLYAKAELAVLQLSWFPFFLFDTDWMGREVYHGDPNGDLNERKAYDNGVREGLATGVLNLAIVVPQIVVSLGAGPWDALYGGGNIPAFALASIFSLAAGVLAVLKLPKLSNSYQSAGFHGFG
nr:unnamed protein product [Digitaria exilis]CAB3451566.1 unnamed protein product [Digitaria exilis]